MPNMIGEPAGVPAVPAAMTNGSSLKFLLNPSDQKQDQFKKKKTNSGDAVCGTTFNKRVSDSSEPPASLKRVSVSSVAAADILSSSNLTR